MKVVNRKKKECTVENIKRKWMKCRIDHEDHEGKEGISPISEHHDTIHFGQQHSLKGEARL